MKALVLAAGRGERLRPLTDAVPKPMLEVGGRSLIYYPLLMLRRAGVVEVAINLHHLGERIADPLGDGSALGLRITYAPEPKLLGTAGPLHGLASFFENEPFVVLNSDTIMDLDLMGMLAAHRACGAIATFALRPIAKPGAYSEIAVSPGDSRVTTMRLLVDRPQERFDIYDMPHAAAARALPMMFCGVTICSPAVLTLPLKPPPSSLMGDLFAPALRAGAPLFGFAYEGYFRTVDDLAAWEALELEFVLSPPWLSYLA